MTKHGALLYFLRKRAVIGNPIPHRLASSILSAVESTLASHSGATVTLVGHSLGAALALLDSVFLPLHLPSSTAFKTITYGMPRVGNQAFANYVDASVHDLTHVNNKEDPIPILPGMFLGFHHPSGEVHIQDSEAWDACPGEFVMLQPLDGVF
jgi:predicted lipase